MSEELYKYVWGNNKTIKGKYRLQFKNRLCKVLVWGKKNTCLIEFIDNDEPLSCSRNALRKVE